MKLYIGIDPGSVSGCIAFTDADMRYYYTIEFAKFTTRDWFKELKELTENEECFAVLEKVHGHPDMSVQSVTAFMKNVGHIEMALLALDIPFVEVTPQTWMKHYNLKKEKEESKVEWKRRLREHLQRIMPQFKVNNSNSDAMLIALYARNTDK